MPMIGQLIWPQLIFLLAIGIVILKVWKQAWYYGIKFEIFLSGNFSLNPLGCESRGAFFYSKLSRFAAIKLTGLRNLISAFLRVKSSLYKVPFMPCLPSIKASKISLQWDTGLLLKHIPHLQKRLWKAVFCICISVSHVFHHKDNT